MRQPRPGEHCNRQTQPTSYQRRKWICAQLVPWSTVPYHQTYRIHRSEPGNLDPGVSQRKRQSDFNCERSRVQRNRTHDRRGWNLQHLQWCEAEERPGTLAPDVSFPPSASLKNNSNRSTGPGPAPRLLREAPTSRWEVVTLDNWCAKFLNS